MAQLTSTTKLDQMILSTVVTTADEVSSFVNATATEVKGYTDSEITKLNEKIAALEGFTTFLGVFDTVEELPTPEKEGCIALVGSKEFIWGKVNDTLVWTELGDTTAEMTAITELSSAVADLETTVNNHGRSIAEANARIDTVNSTLTSSVEVLGKAIEAVEASLSGYDTVGSADAALTSAKAYTVEQVGALSTEVHHRMDEEYRAAEAYTDSRISALESDIDADISSIIATLDTKADKDYVEGEISTLNKAIDDVEASLSGYDTVGSAAAAQEAAISAAKAYTDEQDTKLYGEVANHIGETAHNLSTDYINRINTTASTFADGISAVRAYTDEQIAAVEGEISSLTDVVETKADQTAVDAAISAINENISTLSAKAEEDPIFTAWKNGTTVALGSNAEASGESSNAIGSNSYASGESSNAIGYGSNATENYSNAIGSNSYASGESSNAIGYSAEASGESSNAIGSNADASGESSNAIGSDATAIAEGATQIGVGTNEVANSFKFRSTQIVDGDGFITTTNLAGIDALKTTVSAIEEVTAEDNVQVLREAVNTLVAAIKTFVGA